jgi:hypothetical protein
VDINIKIANRAIKNVTELKYFGTAVADQNLIQEEIKWQLNLGMLATIQSFSFFACCLKK